MFFDIRWAVIASLLGAQVVAGYVLGSMPSQTMGVGFPLMEIMPTSPPSLELARKQVAKRSLTNTCSEWTVLGIDDFTPYCTNSETCLFTSATDGYGYEGCAQTSISYRWYSTCSPYPPPAGETAPPSEIWCPSTARSCGIWSFIYNAESTYYNFGCDTTSYAITAILAQTISSANLASQTVTVTTAPNTPATPTPSPSASGGSGSGTPTNKSLSSKSSVPIAAIVGGTIGGVLLIVAAVAIGIWCCCKANKKKKKAAAVQAEVHEQYPPASAFAAAPGPGPNNSYPQNNANNPNRFSELHSSPKPALYAGVAPISSPQNEKPGLVPSTQDFYSPNGKLSPPMSPSMSMSGSTNGNELPTDRISTQSPPPQYASPLIPSASPVSMPSSSTTELLGGGRQSVPPVSPVTTGTGRFDSVGGMSELAENHGGGRMDGGRVDGMQEMGPGDLRARRQEMGDGDLRDRRQELSGTGGIAQTVRPQPRVDMSGNPLGEWQGQHELE